MTKTILKCKTLAFEVAILDIIVLNSNRLENFCMFCTSNVSSKLAIYCSKQYENVLAKKIKY